MGTESDSGDKSGHSGGPEIEHQFNKIRPRESVQRIHRQRISPDQIVVVEARPSYLHSAKFLGLGFFLGVATLLGIGVFLLPRVTPVAPVAKTAEPVPSSSGSLADTSNRQPSATAPETKTAVIAAPTIAEHTPIKNMSVAVEAPVPPPPAVEATVSPVAAPTPPKKIKPKETPPLPPSPVASQSVSERTKPNSEVALAAEPDRRVTQAEGDETNERYSIERDSDGRILMMKSNPNSAGEASLIDKIGVKAKYTYLTGPEPVSTTYFDSHNKVIPVEVEVMEITENGVASAIGLQPGDRLLTYDGEKLRSVQRLVFLTGMPGEAPRKLSYRHGKRIVTVDVPVGRLGVEVKNVRALGSPGMDFRRASH